MRLVNMVAIAAHCFATCPAIGAAQGRVPAAGSMAVGGEAGIFVPNDDFEPSPIIGGFFESYPTARQSLRPSAMLLDPGFDREPSDSLRQTRIGCDVIYSWEHGRWHPFAGGGVAAHLLRLKDDGHAIGDGRNQFGISGLGGVEYFVDRRNALTFERPGAVRR